MKNAVVVAALAVSFVFFARAENIVGDWQGTLKAGPAELRLVLHVSKDSKGALQATLDSIDQGANGIPVTSISLQNSKLSFSVDAVRGSYEGKLSAAGTAIEGSWSQGQSLPLVFNRTSAPTRTQHKSAAPSDIDGVWLGTLDTGMGTLRLVFHITNTEDGLTAALDSLDQGIKGIPATAVTRNGSSIRLELKQIAGAFEGKIDKSLTTMEGTWTQAGNTLPLTLKRTKDASEMERRRPQNPVKPYPYREQEVAYDSKAAGVRLAATLTLPPGQGPVPAVLLIAGSGPHDRDETLMGHRPFLVLSDYLTRKGIAVLRADKRGCGKSTGNFSTATAADFAIDAEAGVAYLKTRSEIDPRRIGLIGHSEGGTVAPMLAARDSDVAFIVMMAGPGVPGDAILVSQTLLLSEAGGKTHEEAEQSAALEQQVLTLVKNNRDDARLAGNLRKEMAGDMPEAQLDAQIQALTSPWFRYFLTYDPASALSKLRIPVLAINGEKDLQVSPKQNLPAIREALESAGNKNFAVEELPGLNHLFQTAKTGALGEYAELEETMSPVALARIAGWISRL